jgi:hypothetical protein
MMSIRFYAEGGPVPREDLYESCRDNIEFMFGHLGDLGPRDLSAPRRTGRRRAEQGAPIAAVLSSFRIGFAFIWDCVVTEARQSGTLSDAELVQIASDVWALHEAFTMEMMTAYRDELTKHALQRDRERSALVEALLAGPLADLGTVWEVADLLGLPYGGVFAETALARQPLPNIENRLRAQDIGSAWRLLPDLQVGIVSLRSPETVEPIAMMLRSAATARIGVSPAYTGLEKTPAGAAPGPSRAGQLRAGQRRGVRVRRRPAAGAGGEFPGDVLPDSGASAGPADADSRGRAWDAAGHAGNLLRGPGLGGRGRKTAVLPPQHGAPPAAPHRAPDRPSAERPQIVSGTIRRLGGAAHATRAGRRLRLKRPHQAKAPSPVMSRPTRSVWISAVPS